MAEIQKYAGESTIQAVVNETKKLVRPEVAVGSGQPPDDNIVLFVDESQKGTSPNDFYTKAEMEQNFYTKAEVEQDFYTKAEVDKIKNDLLTTINAAQSWKLKVKGAVADPANYPISGGTGGYAAQSVTISTVGWESGVCIIDCKTEFNPEATTYIGGYVRDYLFTPTYLAGNKSSGYIELEQTSPTTIKIINPQPGCGRVFYNIWVLPFVFSL